MKLDRAPWCNSAGCEDGRDTPRRRKCLSGSPYERACHRRGRFLRPRTTGRRWAAERGLRRGRACGWPGRAAAAWLAVRHPQLRRGRGRCSRPRGTGCSYPISAASGRRAFSRPRRRATVSRRRWPSTPSRLMDALGIERAVVGRLRLGRAHRRHRRRAVAGALQGAGLGERLSDRQPGGRPVAASAGGRLQWWYQYYFATERGRAGYARYRREFAKLIWRTLRRSGPSTTRPSIAVRQPSTTQITST